MKNQYFGDINDFRKYGLLRAILGEGKPRFKMLVAWMLTEDDGRSDGKFTSYLNDSMNWERFDPVLYSALCQLMSSSRRNVGLIEKSELLPEATYFSKITPDNRLERDQWFNNLESRSKGCDLVFLDPDNGLEIKSKPYGRKSSSKYLYWPEVESLWKNGKSLLIYQHFIREERSGFIQKLHGEFTSRTPESKIEAFSTANVVFFLVLQPNHAIHLNPIVRNILKHWQGQITPSVIKQ